MIEIKNISKWYGSFQVLANCTTHVSKGEVVVVCGPSGSGKSTLIKCVNGLEPFQAGEILVNGVSVGAPGTDLPRLRSHIGMLFQNFELFPHMNVTDNISLAQIKVLGRGREEAVARVDQLLKRVGLSEHAHKYPGQLSGGQQQRIALARALATSPGLLLLDEPLSALDAQVRVRLRGEIRQLQQRLGVTTILVTHDQEEALSIADRVVVMNQGAIDQVGTPLEVYREPASPFVADFVGKTNLLPAVVRDGAELEIGKLRLKANGASARFKSGTPVAVFLRPEDVVVSGAGDDAPGSFAGRIENIEFLGAVCRLGIRVDGLESQLVTADFSPRDMAEFRIERGLPVRVSLPGASIRIFAKSN